MARKSKDLFVILAERQGKSRGESARERAGATAGELGDKLGRWVKGAVQAVRSAPAADGTGGDRASRDKASPDKTSPDKTSRDKAAAAGRGAAAARRAALHVPRGLLIPGWLLAGGLISAFGVGLLTGNVMSAFGSAEEGLDARPGAQVPEGYPGPDGTGAGGGAAQDLALADETLPPAGHYEGFLLWGFPPSAAGRADAVALARHFRALGLEKARVLGAAGTAWWAVYYVAPREDEASVKARLAAVPPPPFLAARGGNPAFPNPDHPDLLELRVRD